MLKLVIERKIKSGDVNLKCRIVKLKSKFHKWKIKNKENIMGYMLLLPSLIGTSIFMLIPFIDAFVRSFKEAMSGKFVGIDNYKTVIENKAFSLGAYNTIKFTLICIPMLLVISLIISSLIINMKRYSDFFRTSYLIPLSIPVASIVLLWKVFFHDNGLLNKFISNYGIESISWLNTSNAFYVLVFTYIWKNCGYDMVIWSAGLNNISESLYEAASIDGCGKIKKLIYITLPNLKTTVFTVTALSLINSFKVFREAYLICGNYPDDSIYMMQHLFNNWFVNMDVQKMCAAAMMMAGIIFIIMIIMQYLSEDRDMT